ncbi:hypothetical protein PoB_007367800 [Plakobranchus ocellatus]|uniref:Secreted protein n=1 Tax=Plakobranchus ocellatus TaxID=259542 RepID=A0AAV4DS64_9GAST|nr:hypothetical protein PoB_007367800 [Plakobranchus ocellatus]
MCSFNVDTWFNTSVALLCSSVGFIIQLMAFSSPNWSVATSNRVSLGLWKRCYEDMCFDYKDTEITTAGVRPGCKTQRMAPTLRRDGSRSRLGVLSPKETREVRNMYCWTRELLPSVWARLNCDTQFVSAITSRVTSSVGFP